MPSKRLFRGIGLWPHAADHSRVEALRGLWADRVLIGLALHFLTWQTWQTAGFAQLSQLPPVTWLGQLLASTQAVRLIALCALVVGMVSGLGLLRWPGQWPFRLMLLGGLMLVDVAVRDHGYLGHVDIRLIILYLFFSLAVPFDRLRGAQADPDAIGALRWAMAGTLGLYMLAGLWKIYYSITAPADTLTWLDPQALTATIAHHHGPSLAIPEVAFFYAYPVLGLLMIWVVILAELLAPLAAFSLRLRPVILTILLLFHIGTIVLMRDFYWNWSFTALAAWLVPWKRLAPKPRP